MPKYPKYKYEFEVDGEIFFLAVKQSKSSKDGIIVKVEKFESINEMNYLWISLDGSNWQYLEKGKRTPLGKVHNDFKRFEVAYPSNCPDGAKIKEAI